MDVVCKGSSVKGCPGKTRESVKKRAQHPPQQHCPGLQTPESSCATGRAGPAGIAFFPWTWPFPPAATPRGLKPEADPEAGREAGVPLPWPATHTVGTPRRGTGAREGRVCAHLPLASLLLTILAPNASTSISAVPSWLLILQRGREGKLDQG